MRKLISLLLVLSMTLVALPVYAEDNATFSGYCSWVGDWKTSSAVKGPFEHAGETFWINGVGSEATLTYYPEITYPSEVTIDVYLLYWHQHQNNRVKYEVHHNGKVDTFILDPTTLTESCWKNLGTFDFKGDQEREFVRLVCMPGQIPGANTRASAMRFTTSNETFYVAPNYTVENALNGSSIAPLNKFSDMENHWARYDVEYMANEGLVSGVEDSLFDPEAQITRAEYVTILDRALGLELYKGGSYSDVSPDAWYAPYVATAKAGGLLKGLPTDDGFKPDQPITREEMALFTYNAILQTRTNDEWISSFPDVYSSFTDTDAVSEWAKEAMSYLTRTNIIKGTTDTTVSPKETATRAQGTVILKRFMQQFVWAGPPKGENWVMTFNDEFSGNELDWSIWRSEAAFPSHILSSRWPENVEMYDGNLHLITRKEQMGGAEWTSASVWVRPEFFRQSYGYWEARYKYAPASGLNNAFWITTQPLNGLPMEKHYELDINEGHFPNEINTNYHARFGGNTESNGEIDKSEYNLSEDYHTYGIEWGEDELKYYFDGEVIAVKANNTKGLHADVAIVPYLSTAVLDWAGPIVDELSGKAMVVDYVRVWQKEKDANNPDRTIKGMPLEGVSPSGEKPGSVETDTNVLKDIKIVSVAEQTVDNTAYPGEIIIPCVTEGDWSKSTAIPNYNGGEHYWSSTPNAVVRYPLKGISSGNYDIYIWRTPHQFNVRQMDMILTQHGKNALCGSVALRLAENETAEPGWILLGNHTISDPNGYIYYISNGTNCRATAVKLVPKR